MDDGDDTDVVVLVAVAEVVVHVASCSYMVRRGKVVRNRIFLVFDRISSSVVFLLFQLDLDVDVRYVMQCLPFKDGVLVWWSSFKNSKDLIP